MRRRLFLSVVLLSLVAGCSRTEPPKQYALRGQVLSVNLERQQLTVRHEDIPDLMPSMTMSFPVASPDLLEGREAGELIAATLEVSDVLGTLVAVTRTGMAPLPDDAEFLALATSLLDVGDQVPDAAFIDERDIRLAFSDWAGQHTLVTFIYTQCPLPNFCPLMDQNFSTIQRAVAEDNALRGRVRLVSISFDPEHDTPAMLAAHAARLGADPAVWSFLTGDRVTIDRFAARFGVGVIRPPDGARDITHNLRTTLIDPDLRVAAIYSGSDWTPGAVLADLRQAIKRP